MTASIDMRHTPAMRFTPLGLALFLVGCPSPSEPTDAGADARGSDAGSVDAGPPLVVATVEDLGALPHPSETVVGRDGASSGVIDGQLLWTFGDTFVSHVTPIDGSNVITATGAWATPGDPLTLEQPVDGDGLPAQLIPYTDDEIAQNQLDPLDGWALWPGAVIDTGDPELLVLFQRIKRTDGSGFDGVGLGTARIAPRETVARRDPVLLFERTLPPDTMGDPLYGTGGVSVIGDTVYWFACGGGGCRLARTPRARADEREAFEFYDGSAWSAEIDDAAIVFPWLGAAHSVSWNEHLGAFLSVSSGFLSNDVVLRTAPAIEGPWPITGIVITPSDDGVLAAGEGSNYLAQEQVALSDADGTSIVISYSRPLGSFRGEIRLARITFD